jgi:hypothetical protein
MAVIPAARLARPGWWPDVAVWALWVLAMLGIPVIAWLAHPSRQAGRPDLAELGGGLIQGPVLALVIATTVGATLAGRWARYPIGWLPLTFGRSLLPQSRRVDR